MLAANTIANSIVYFILGALAGAFTLVYLTSSARKHISLQFAGIVGSIAGGILYIALGQTCLVPPVGSVVLATVTLVCLLLFGQNSFCQSNKRAIE